MKIFLTLLLALSLQASKYDVNYRGMTLGEISDLSTIKDLYLKAKVTSRVARFLLGKDNFVYYSGEKPDVKKSKFKKDKKMMLQAFALSLKERPAFKKVKINDIKNITLSCKGKSCEFVYYKNDEVNGKGKILFDENDEFVSITEEMSNFEIIRQ
jgi:hypothetical protein